MSKKTINPADEIWAIIKEVAEQQKEISEQQKKTDAQIKKTSEEVKKTSKKVKKLSEEVKKLSEKVEKTSESVEKTSPELKEDSEEFNKIFEKLGLGPNSSDDSLNKDQLTERLEERGIKVEQIVTDMKNQIVRSDIVVINKKEIVIIGIELTLKLDHVQRFLEHIKKFKTAWPLLIKGKQIIGALAFLTGSNSNAVAQAKKEGLFVISATGDLIIKNKKSFQPKSFVN